MADNKPVALDIDGYEYVTDALMEMANSYPGLNKMVGEHFDFTNADPEDGLTIMATSGSVIYDERESITGHVRQECTYPFMVVYKASGLSQKRKIQVKEWMDTFARWMTRQPVTINNRTFVLQAWPELTHGRVIRTIQRQSPCYLAQINEDKSEIWAMDLVIRYRNEFNR